MNSGKSTPTRKDVAQLAGVSVTVVSYVLNNNRYVAQDKREKVLQAVKELHYRPNTVARALKGKKSNHILFIADNISNEHFGKIVEEMDRLAYAKGYLISLLADRNDEEFVAQVNSRLVDGIVISSASFEEKYVLELIATGVPVVLLMNREYSKVNNSAGKIYTGLRQGTEECVKFLAAQGRRNILYIDRVSRHNRFSTLSDLRYRGFCEQMQKCGFQVDESTVISGYSSEEALAEGLRERIRGGLKVDGIVGRNDNLACVAMAAVQDCGLQVPHDVSVIGFDNSRLSSYVRPPLTSMEIDRAGIAEAIITMLDDQIAGKPPVTRRFNTRLILREST